MASTNWARQRKSLYTFTVLGVVVVILGIMSFRMFYEAPTCFDGKRNGGEVGVDCGGNCRRVCESEASPLVVQWEKIFKIRDGVYSAVAYIENPNRVIGAESLPYEFSFYDASGELIEKISGVTYSLPHTSFPIFEGPISLREEPARMEFSLTGEAYLLRSEREEVPLSVENATLMSSETRPKIQALLANDSIDSLSQIEAIALVFDGSGEAVAASRTTVPEISQGSRRRITFTWPEAFREEYEVCSAPTTSVLAIDRSGSMGWAGSNPPQPITDALAAALVYVDSLTVEDRIGVVSYATNASVDASVSFDRATAASAIENIRILPEDEVGYTNIGEAIKDAYEQILENANDALGEEEGPVIILLTDGVANWPTDPGGERYAEIQSDLAKRGGVSIYTVGLGDEINRDFLSAVATGPEYYFEAATAEDLVGIYEEIASAVCSYGPSVVEITPRYNNVSAHR